MMVMYIICTSINKCYSSCFFFLEGPAVKDGLHKSNATCCCEVLSTNDLGARYFFLVMNDLDT